MVAVKSNIVVLLGLILTISSCVSNEIEEQTAESGASREDIFRLINDEVLKNSLAYETLKNATTTIGHRLTGSENGRRTEEYVFDLLKSYGYDDVEYHEFEATSWTRENASLKIYHSPGNIKQTGQVETIPVVALAHTPVRSEAQGILVDVGNGLRENFEENRSAVRGNIALVNIGIYPVDSTLKNLHRSEKTALAIEYGAVGVVFINTVEGNILLTGTASVTGELISIPAVCVSLETGQQFRESMKKEELTASISMTNKSEKIKARNIIATIKGKELPGEEIIIGGHLDSWDLSVGAIDNGIGSFAVIEMARVFKKLGLQPKRTVRFMLFMGEEQGLLGSKAYLRDRTNDKSINHIRYMINLDMDGNPVGFNVSGRSMMEAFINEVGAEIAKVDSVFKNRNENRVSLHSDHQAFMLEGIPVLGLASNLDPSIYRFYHSNKDDFSLVNREHMNNSVRFTAMMLYALANADAIAAKGLTSQETKEFFEKANLREELVLGNEWKW